MAVRALVSLLVVSALLAFPAAAAGVERWRWPVRGEVLRGYDNGPSPYAGGRHRGVDIAASSGTRVVAAVGGKVRFAGSVGSSGRVVSVASADGRFVTAYLHLDSISARAGSEVRAGDEIGSVGTSGSRRSSAEPHLHFGVRDAGNRHAYRDPLDFLGAPTGATRYEPRRPEPLTAPSRPRAAKPPAAKPHPVGADRREPGRARRPVGLAQPHPAPLPAHPAKPLAAGGLGEAPREPAAEPARRARAASRPDRVADIGPAARRQPERSPAVERPAVIKPTPHGINLGWLAALVACVAAAIALGRPDATLAAAARARAGIASLVRPLTGRG